jgi:integrase
MAKAVSKFGTREKRKGLKARGKPYWEALEKGFDFGYRKGRRGGSWALRQYLSRDDGYREEKIGRADDEAAEPGALAYDAARGLARSRMQELVGEARIASAGPPLTVQRAIDEYVAGRDARELASRGGDKARKAVASKGLKKDARSRLKHVDEKLGAKPLAAISADGLAKWREGLDMKPSSVQRVVNDFRAALNLAARRYKAQLPPTIRDTIKDGLAAVNASASVAREAQVLPDADVRRIISAAKDVDLEGGWDGDLHRIVLALAATGARFSQVIRMTVGDVQAAQKRVMVPVSRKGRGIKQATHIGVRVGDDVLAALAKATAGRKGGEPLFLRPHWRQIGPARWERAGREPWIAAAELTRPWAKIISKAGLPAGTVAYSLRHSAVVRGLRSGLPIRLVAALADTSSAMIEKHYSAFIIDAMDELAAKAVVPLTTEPTPVISIERARAS